MLLEYTKAKVSAEPPLFVLGDTHMEALSSLRNALKSKKNLPEALRSVLNTLYFPNQAQRDRGYIQPIRAFPILQYLSFAFLTDDGNYLPIHRIPPLLAQHQYCIRLRGLYKINEEVQSLSLQHYIRLDSIHLEFHSKANGFISQCRSEFF